MPFGTMPYGARPAGDGVFAGMGVVGTLGTADTGGTAQLLPMAIDPTTGAVYQREIGTPIFQPNYIPTVSQITYGTLGTAGALAIGTLAGGTSSGAGTELFVTSIAIVIPANAGSQDVSIGFGTNGGALHQGTGLLARGNFIAGGGIARTFTPPVNSGTNAQITFVLGGAGTAMFEVSYFTTTSTL